MVTFFQRKPHSVGSSLNKLISTESTRIKKEEELYLQDKISHVDIIETGHDSMSFMDHRFYLIFLKAEEGRGRFGAAEIFLEADVYRWTATEIVSKQNNNFVTISKQVALKLP